MNMFNFNKINEKQTEIFNGNNFIGYVDTKHAENICNLLNELYSNNIELKEKYDNMLQYVNIKYWSDCKYKSNGLCRNKDLYKNGAGFCKMRKCNAVKIH